MTKQRIINSVNFRKELAIAISECEHDRIFILTDEVTRRVCLPKIEGFYGLRDASIITIGAGDEHKNLDSLASVWHSLDEGGATRHSLLINLGGGMVTDLGGFAAATFKRGINFINIPTTLLAMVDASVGGKTGINFGGLKNEVGAFCDSRTVIINTTFLDTLDAGDIRSGYAEMLKHGLISSEQMWGELVCFDLARPNLPRLQQMVVDSVAVKEHVVTIDPLEKGLRKALNLGHTIGHAFESLSLKRQKPIQHGYAVAYGLICEMFLSCVKTGFPQDRMRQTVSFIREHYGQMNITCDDYAALLELMHHDKKNTGGDINFTLLAGIGDVRINQIVSEEDIREALDFYREG